MEKTSDSEATTQKPTEKKNILARIKESIDEEHEQVELLSTLVRLGILIWSGSILTLAYVKMPPFLKIPEQKLDPTFIASVFTGVLASFGVQTAKKHGDGTFKAQGQVSKADLEKLIERAAATAPAQTIRLEQAPIKFVTDDKGGEPPVKPSV